MVLPPDLAAPGRRSGAGRHVVPVVNQAVRAVACIGYDIAGCSIDARSGSGAEGARIEIAQQVLIFDGLQKIRPTDAGVQGEPIAHAPVVLSVELDAMHA